MKFSGAYERIYQIDEFLLERSNIIITTPEKLDLLLRRKGYDFLEQFSLIVLDEFQLIEDPTRGTKYELLLTRIKNQVQEMGLALDFTILSASIPISNLVELLEWFDANRSSSFHTDWKPTRLMEGFYDVQPDDNSNHYLRIFFIDILQNYSFPLTNYPSTIDDQILCLLTKLIENFSPVMLFYERKDTCENIIQKIYENRSSLHLELIDDPVLDSTIEFIAGELGESNDITEYLKYGLVFHHAGLPVKVRTAVEELIRNRLVKIFSCTTTFAQGINFPVHSIIFHSVYLYSELSGKTDLISPKLFFNIIGRAGRALKYNEGLVLVHDPYQKFRSLVDPDELTSNLPNLTQYPIADMILDIDSFIENTTLLSDLQVDLLSFEDVSSVDLVEYVKTTYFFAKLKVQNRIADIQRVLPYFEMQKEFLQNFSYPAYSEVIFRESGLNLVFCKKLHDFLIDNEYPVKFLEAYNNGVTVTEIAEFSEINGWVFQNLPDLRGVDQQDYNLVNLWVNRKAMNYQDIYQQSPDQGDFFRKMKIINSEICPYFPWVWTVILRILASVQPALKDYLKYVPYFLKFGANSLPPLIDEIYANNKDIVVDGELLTKERIKEIMENESSDDN